MRRAFLALVAIGLASPAWAQETEMDRAERDVRASMAASGAEVERVAPDEVRVRMPSDITFDFNRADLRYQFRPRVRELAATLSRYPRMSVTVVGHADAIGSDSYNQVLSERRAAAVAEALLEYGIDWGRIDVSGRGEWDPIASNDSEWGRSRNRRVEISIKTTK
jgi:outer membrane protein OmpA-like peptidoglycan-associated protein